MDIAFASETLRPISSKHILARRITEPEVLQQMADSDPLGLIKLLMKSFDNKATIEQIEKALVPVIVAEEDWKSWWTSVRAQMRKCGNFVIPSRKIEPIIYQPSVNSLQQRYLNDFQQAKGFKPQLSLLEKIIQNINELDNPQELAQEIIPELNKEIKRLEEHKPAFALEGIFLRDELKHITEIKEEEEVTPKTFWEQHPNGVKIIEEIPPSVHKEAIFSFKETFPDTWANLFLENLNNVTAKFCGELIDHLMAGGYTDKIRDLFHNLINQHQASSEFLLWFAKNKPEAFEELMNVNTLRAMLAAIERDQFNNVRSNKLRDSILNDKKLVQEMISFADIEEVKDLTRALQFSPAFEDMDKRSILMRIVKLFPPIQTLVSGEPTGKQDSGLVVSWESLTRKKEEYADLLHNRIPANTKEVAIARSYGDLRENHEFKAAREMQKQLLKFKSEMEIDLDRAQGTDFRDVDDSEVNIGTKVALKDNATGVVTVYTILGAWDFDEAKNIISYLSPIAQAALHKKQGEIVEFNEKKYTIESIAPAVTE